MPGAGVGWRRLFERTAAAETEVQLQDCPLGGYFTLPLRITISAWCLYIAMLLLLIHWGSETLNNSVLAVINITVQHLCTLANCFLLLFFTSDKLLAINFQTLCSLPIDAARSIKQSNESVVKQFFSIHSHKFACVSLLEIGGYPDQFRPHETKQLGDASARGLGPVAFVLTPSLPLFLFWPSCFALASVITCMSDRPKGIFRASTHLRNFNPDPSPNNYRL